MGVFKSAGSANRDNQLCGVERHGWALTRQDVLVISKRCQACCLLFEECVGIAELRRRRCYLAAVGAFAQVVQGRYGSASSRAMGFVAVVVRISKLSSCSSALTADFFDLSVGAIHLVAGSREKSDGVQFCRLAGGHGQAHRPR